MVKSAYVQHNLIANAAGATDVEGATPPPQGTSAPREMVAEGVQFTTIDDPNGAHGRLPFGINSRRDIMGEYFDAAFAPHGFLLRDGNFTTIDNPNAVHGTRGL